MKIIKFLPLLFVLCACQNDGIVPGEQVNTQTQASVLGKARSVKFPQSKRGQNNKQNNKQNNQKQTKHQKNKSSYTKVFTILNNFHPGFNGEPIYIRLVSNKKDMGSYIIPPARYGDLILDDMVMRDYKVVSGCIDVPEKAFPVSVYICLPDGTSNSAQKCDTMSREPLAEIVLPQHYGLAGIGGLMTVEINPVSPCSQEYEDIIRDTSYL